MGAASRTRAQGGPRQKQAPPSARPAAPETGRRGQGPPAACPRLGTQRKWVTGERVCVPRTGARAATAHPRIMLLTEAPGPGYNLARYRPSPAAPPKQQEGLSWLTGVDGVAEAPSGRWTVRTRRTREGPALGEGGLQAEEPPSCSRGPAYGEAGKWGVTRPQPATHGH